MAQPVPPLVQSYLRTTGKNQNCEKGRTADKNLRIYFEVHHTVSNFSPINKPKD
jgi:hypothetical protein